MKNLVYKEVKISINKFFFLLPILLGLLMFIPTWIFLLVFMYFFWVSAPQIYAGYVAHQDTGFTMMLPVSKKEIVKSKIYALFILEGLHIFFGFLFGIFHNIIFGQANLFFDINIAFFGVVLVLFTVFNIVFLPQYFKTGYYFGKPVIWGIIVTMIYAFVMEFSAIRFAFFRNIFEGSLLSQTIVLIISLIITLLVNLIAINKSVENYESSL